MSSPVAVVVFSGGLDSTAVAAHYAFDHTLVLVTVDYGQRHRREISAARAIAAHYGAEHLVVDATAIGALLGGSALTDDIDVPEGHYEAESMRATVVPNRNAILANIAVGVAVARRAEVVALGVHAGDHAIYPDCTPEFIEALARLVETATAGMHTPQIHAPFVQRTKAWIVGFAARVDAPLALTWSCYQGGEEHCGRCGTCTERAAAFVEAGVPDPTAYADPDYWRSVIPA